MHQTETNLDLILKYPSISSQISGNIIYHTGKIMCKGQDITLEIEENISSNTFNLKTAFSSTINENIANISALNVVDFIDYVIKILDESIPQTENLSAIYRKTINEYYEFTGFHLSIKNCQISADLSTIDVTTNDESGRNHSLVIQIDPTKSNIFIPKNIDLPQVVLKNFAESYSNLNELYNTFTSAVDSLQLFFEIMDDLDGSFSILDPVKLSRKDCYRRLWLDHNLSVIVTVNPLNPKSRPDLKFLGPEHVVNQYYQKLNDNLESWDDSMNTLDGLLNILGLGKIPLKPKTEGIVLTDIGECSICFSFRLNDKLPEIVCDNKSCGNVYHVGCLYEWLVSVNSKRIFNQFQGQCPNCEKKIVCPLPEELVS